MYNYIDFAIIHVYFLINHFSESKFEMSMDFWPHPSIIDSVQISYKRVMLHRDLENNYRDDILGHKIKEVSDFCLNANITNVE